ncbi:hypothetical protein F5884DRAFT_886895 [Xylogone sp. PMI_703]|nr:hypothetical protein F5884DRAFT_886895 [Xylogone sp. PMI_703]
MHVVDHAVPLPTNNEEQIRQYRIDASILIPGRGEPSKDASVAVHGDKIVWVGSQLLIPEKYMNLPVINVPVLMPGLWDCHVHFMGLNGDDKAGYAKLLGSQALAGARTVRDLQRTLFAGFTSVRELGGYGGEIYPAVLDGSIIGPNIYSSIAPLSITAGHGDIHNFPLGTVLDACAHGSCIAICDGVPDCVKTVRQMIRRGAKVIKVYASGGVLSLIDDPHDAQFSPEELRAIVEEAARSRRVVAAHCHGKEGIINAINAGVKTIEHGSYLDEECIAIMKEKDVVLVATALIVESGLQEIDKLPLVTREKALKTAEAHRKAYALAVKSGVKIALGTDQSTSENGSLNTHGRNGKEFLHAVRAGLTPLQAIEAGTATAPETLGSYMAPKSGQLKEGYDADMIALSENPLEDISILSDADNIRYVWKGGNLLKSPL